MPVVSLPPYTPNTTNYALGAILRSGFGSWSFRNTVGSFGTATQNGTPEFAGTGFSGGARGTYECSRAYIWYDVSSYQSVTINSAYLQCPTVAVLGMTLTLDVIASDSTAFNNNTSTTLATSDFTNTSYTAYSNPTAWVNTTGFQNITLNALAIAQIQSGNSWGVSIMDESYDFQNATPPGAAYSLYYLGDMSSAGRPRWTLNIDYSSGWTGGDVNDVANSDIDEINGVPKSDIAELNGV